MLSTSELLEGRKRYDAVSGLYRNTRHDDFFWFAFRRPGSWVQLDAETRSNGDLHLEVDGAPWALLIVDGAAALRVRQSGPGYRRLHGMVQHGMTWPGPPDETETTTWEGRTALRCRWHRETEGEALFDAVSGLVVRTGWPEGLVELTDLHFDDEVERHFFDPRARTMTGFRGGSGHILQNEATGRCSASWQPRSGPGSLHVPGPSDATIDEATEWVRERTDDIHISVERPRP